MRCFAVALIVLMHVFVFGCLSRAVEFRVNTTTAGNQDRPSVAIGADGQFVVTWYGMGVSDDAAYARRYNRSGIPQGDEFRVNTSSSHSYPCIAMAPDGTYIVAWSGSNVYAQRYDSSGAPLGSEFVVNTFTSAPNRLPGLSAAMDAQGNFVLAWYSYPGGEDVYARVYDSTGNPQGPEFRVNTTTADLQAYPSVAMDTDGDFVVAWRSGFSSPDVYAQRFNSLGVAQGSEFRVNTYTGGSQERASVGMDADGNFVVAWDSSFNSNSDHYDVWAQRYDSSGVAQGDEFRVNSYTPDFQAWPEVDMDASGNFAVAFTSRSEGSSPGDLDVFVRRFSSLGAPLETEFRVNTFTAGHQDYSTLAMNGLDHIVVAWNSDGQDGDGWGVYADIFFIPEPNTFLLLLLGAAGLGAYGWRRRT